MRQKCLGTVFVLTLVCCLLQPAHAVEETVFGPEELRIGRWGIHLSFHRFSVQEPGRFSPPVIQWKSSEAGSPGRTASERNPGSTISSGPSPALPKVSHWRMMLDPG